MHSYVIIFATFILNVYEANAYVLLQVRNKGNNHSAIDAVIHKTIASENVEQLTKRIARKHYSPKPEMRSHDVDSQPGNIYVSIDDSKKQSTLLKDVGDIVGVLLDKISDYTETGFNYRAKEPLVVPKKINFRSKPSLMYEINTNSILDVVNHVLASEPVRRFVDTVSAKAAAVYGSNME